MKNKGRYFGDQSTSGELFRDPMEILGSLDNIPSYYFFYFDFLITPCIALFKVIYFSNKIAFNMIYRKFSNNY